jgi:hypothetical protein
VIRGLSLGLAGVVGLACVVGALPPDSAPKIRSALSDLDAAGFRFDADVRFRVDPYAVCEGLACADLVTLKERRTVLLAPEALRSDAVLRATLLEIWERYREPRPGSERDLARGALRVVQDGAAAGVDDEQVLERARLQYTQLYRALPRDDREGLPPPAEIALP